MQGTDSRLEATSISRSVIRCATYAGSIQKHISTFLVCKKVSGKLFSAQLGVAAQTCLCVCVCVDIICTDVCVDVRVYGIWIVVIFLL